jgi:hypothetical protein
VDVGPLVEADAEAPELVEPGKWLTLGIVDRPPTDRRRSPCSRCRCDASRVVAAQDARRSRVATVACVGARAFLDVDAIAPFLAELPAFPPQQDEQISQTRSTESGGQDRSPLADLIAALQVLHHFALPDGLLPLSRTQKPFTAKNQLHDKKDDESQ